MKNMRKLLVVAALFAMNSVRAEEAAQAGTFTCDANCTSLLKAAAFGAAGQVVSNAADNFVESHTSGKTYMGYVNSHIFALPTFVAAVTAFEKVQKRTATLSEKAAIVAGWLALHAARNAVSGTKYLTWTAN